MMNKKEICSRITQLFSVLKFEKGINQKLLSEELQVSENTITSWKEKHIPKFKYLFLLRDKFQVNLDWLLEGVGEPFEDNQRITKGDVEIVMIPKVAARLAAGSGSLETCGKTLGMYSFRSDWIHRKGNVSQMVLMDVAGDSMLPEIKNGDMVLIDQSKTDILAYGYFAVGVEDAIYIKQLITEPNKLILHSLNRDYNDIVIDTSSEQPDSVRIIGRVIWWCREAM